VSLPAWAAVTPERRAHVARVAALLDEWAAVMDVDPAERARWARAAWLHDALRDAPGLAELGHGPAAADRAAAEGETDAGVLDAVRYHSVGWARWEPVGRMLYLADYLEPGRRFEAEERRAIASRVPGDPEGALREVTRRRIERALRSGWALRPETVELWNAIAPRGERGRQRS
jgi:2-amino-4-hydroxy-6-hydroxymethyldihydropteridine diphosphokinase